VGEGKLVWFKSQIQAIIKDIIITILSLTPILFTVSDLYNLV